MKADAEVHAAQTRAEAQTLAADQRRNATAEAERVVADATAEANRVIATAEAEHDRLTAFTIECQDAAASAQQAHAATANRLQSLHRELTDLVERHSAMVPVSADMADSAS